MENKSKTIANLAFLLIVFGLTVYGVFHGEDLPGMLAAIRRANWYYLLLGIVCVIFFIWSESIIIWYMMKSFQICLHKWNCFLFSSVGFFFSCITPSATGGQPMQLYYMKKDGISLPVSTVILMIVTITYKLVLVVIGLGIVIFAQGFLHHYLENILPIYYLGIALNVFCVANMLVLVFHPQLARLIMTKGLHFLEHFRVLRRRESRLRLLEESMDLYHETAAYLRNHMVVMVNVFAITFVQRLALFATTWFVYKAFYLSGTTAVQIICLQAVISVSVDMLPLPGGMGISESLFLTIFKPVFGVLLLPGMVLSRGLGYYSQLLVSAIFTIVAHLLIGKSLVKHKQRVVRKEEELHDRVL